MSTFRNTAVKNLKINKLLLDYLTPAATDCILFFADNTFKKGTIISDIPGPADRLLLVQNSRSSGTWTETIQDITMNFNKGNIQCLMHDKSIGYYLLKNGNKRAFYYIASNLKLINSVMALLTEQKMINGKI